MKTILMAVTSFDGIIARSDGSYDWASKEDKEAFFDVYNKAGCIIIGRNTYDIRKDIPCFPNSACLCVVLTHRPIQNAKPNLYPMNATPKDALSFLEKKGFISVIIGGGGQLNTEFMQASLVDEIILDVEPLILGRGIPLFADGDFDARLKLLEIKQLDNHQTIQLHYRVIK